jgi:hypothetical protein
MFPARIQLLHTNISALRFTECGRSIGRNNPEACATLSLFMEPREQNEMHLRALVAINATCGKHEQEQEHDHTFPRLRHKMLHIVGLQ